MLLTLSACKPTPKPIEYGADACEYCKMTIVDQQHGAEVVTKKGRAYKFDAIECMVNYAEQQGQDQFALFLINDYVQPGQLIDATGSTYLISESIPSPMGAFLSGFANGQNARTIQQAKGGALFTWEELLTQRRQKGRLGPE